MLRSCLLALAFGIVASTGDVQLAANQAATAHAVQIARIRGTPTPSVGCIVSKCGGHALKCAIDKSCRSALACTAGCQIHDPKEQNQTCIFQCTSDFETEVYDDLLFCMFNKNDCMGTKEGFDEWQACRSLDNVPPLTEYRGAPVTKEVVRNIIMRGTQQRGDWIVAKGKSHAYDCFDCQYLYWGYNPDHTMYYLANYKIHKSDGGIRWNTALYIAEEWQQSLGRYSMNASNYGGLAHEEDWRMLAADESEDPKWITMYYCGAAAGVGEAYEGAFILTPDGNLPTDAKSIATIDAVFKKAGITLECKTDNSNCTGHPKPPTLKSSMIV
jgi:hypothetical protein